ncbi:MAG: hypothetical protein FWG31_02585 [Oscillospiraceae bacterium]|nr:hypothetical protein [Oscillospiraceae bacterium]
MEAYEFQSSLTDGIIQVPAEFRNKLFGNVKVILMQENLSKNNTQNENLSQKTDFPYFAIDTTGYTFNREEANER